MQARSHGAVSAETLTTPHAEANTPARVIAIIGAGFSGTAVAIQLLRQWGAAAGSLRIVLVDPRDEIGAGVAYATRDYPYPLNVAAGQMSLDSATPGDFLDYARSVGIHAAPGDYLPRQVYGDYLRARLAEARSGARANVGCEHRRARALQLRRGGDGRWFVWLEDGSALRADDVVLAFGNPPPATFPMFAALAQDERIITDPWSIGLPAHRDIDSVLIVGSGLTMIDAALRLAAFRPRVHHIHVLSRHGWLPEPQSSPPVHPTKPAVSQALAAARGSTRRMVRAFRDLARSVRDAGGDWREVLALARPELPAQWHSLDRAQRARFLRHVRSLWDVHRHRAPAGPLSAVRSLERTGVLEIHAGRIEELRVIDDAVEVIWRPRGATRTRAWLVDRVINCTGPDGRADAQTDPLVQSLLANGLMRSDALALGIDVATDGRTLGGDGRPVDRLYYIGPWLRARDWEATAVPELREHAAALARTLVQRNTIEPALRNC
jgi:uncharacterized NAD(P)/FAD-binding protein YdhS